MYVEPFQKIFTDTYTTVHRLDIFSSEATPVFAMNVSQLHLGRNVIFSAAIQDRRLNFKKIVY